MKYCVKFSFLSISKLQVLWNVLKHSNVFRYMIYWKKQFAALGNVHIYMRFANNWQCFTRKWRTTLVKENKIETIIHQHHKPLLIFLTTYRYSKFSSPSNAFLEIFLIWLLFRRLKKTKEQMAEWKTGSANIVRALLNIAFYIVEKYLVTYFTTFVNL